MTAGDRDYVQQLGAVLRRREVGALRAFLIEQAARYGDDRQVAAIEQQGDDELTTLLHRMILARGDLADLHPASHRWLAEHGELPPGTPPGGRRRRPTRGNPSGPSGSAPGGPPAHGRRPPPHNPPRRSPDGPADPGRDGPAEREPGGRESGRREPGGRPPSPGRPPGPGRPFGPGRRPRRPPRPS